tara:strand:- start:14951 stop:15271 length:321 start_codon:yes stop_codon:yes gene_type:complete
VVQIVKNFFTIPWEETEPSELYNSMTAQAREEFLGKSLVLTVVGKKKTGQIQLATEANNRSEPVSLDEPELIAAEILRWFDLLLNCCRACENKGSRSLTDQSAIFS